MARWSVLLPSRPLLGAFGIHEQGQSAEMPQEVFGWLVCLGICVILWLKPGLVELLSEGSRIHKHSHFSAHPVPWGSCYLASADSQDLGPEGGSL